MKLNSKQLRDAGISEAENHSKNVKRNPIYFILENIYDTYNVGGLFRLADALAAEKIFLCGQMEIPPHHKIAKASIGTYKIVPWEYKNTAAEAIEEIRVTYNAKRKTSLNVSDHNKETLYVTRYTLRVIAIEQSNKSKPYTDIKYSLPVAFIVGNETFGVSKEILKLADEIVEIPMWGINKSLNVIVSAAIVSYHCMEKCKFSGKK